MTGKWIKRGIFLAVLVVFAVQVFRINTQEAHSYRIAKTEPGREMMTDSLAITLKDYSIKEEKEDTAERKSFLEANHLPKDTGFIKAELRFSVKNVSGETADAKMLLWSQLFPQDQFGITTGDHSISPENADISRLAPGEEAEVTLVFSFANLNGIDIDKDDWYFEPDRSLYQRKYNEYWDKDKVYYAQVFEMRK